MLKPGTSCQYRNITQTECILRETQISKFYRYAKIPQLLETRQFCRYVGVHQVLKRAKNLVYIAADIFSTANQPRVFLRRLNM
jgi:hypothetical protein